MAESPMSEQYPAGGAVSLSAEPLLPASKSSTDVPTSTIGSHGSKGPGPTCLEPQKECTREASGEDPASRPPTGTETSCAQSATQLSPHGYPEYPSDHHAVDRPPVRPHSIAETSTSTHPQKAEVTMTNHNPQAGGGAGPKLLPASLPMQRSHSDSLHVVREGSLHQAQHSEPCGHGYHGRDFCTQEVQGQSMLACKQSMQLQHCPTVTTICRGANSGASSPTPQPQSGCSHTCIPGPTNTAAEVRGEPCHYAQCEEAICHGSYVHHGNLEDTFAAYCHPQPIPAPVQLLSHLVGLEADGRDQRSLPPHPSVNLLTLPRLISSVSETGLDAKRMLGCCNFNCSWVNALPPAGGSVPQHGPEECCSGTIIRTNPVTRETGTMTTHRELRDVGVQTSQTGPLRGDPHPPPHVFPQVCLVEENGNGINSGQKGAAEGEGQGTSGPTKSPVKEVKWDAEGMTWEVYGASVDPEELGLAIQKHLELQIKETACRAAKLSRQDTNTSHQSSSRWRKRGVMGSIRTPACCARSTSAVD